MKYASTLPLTALSAVVAINLMVYLGILPPGMSILQGMQEQVGEGFYLLICLVILLESIVYVGFYFPGQFFAVVLVILSEPTWMDILLLTLAMVAAATLGSGINYQLGKRFSEPSAQPGSASIRSLLLAMIHMNSLAFYMFAQGANGRSWKVIWLAGLLNLPYYLVLIAGTAFLSEEVMQIAENTWLLIALISVWLVIAVFVDIRKRRQSDLVSDPS